MRKIEILMILAVKKGLSWDKSNTSVVVGEGGGSEVFLHSNHIATVYPHERDSANQRGWRVVVNEATLLEWPTPTTKSRLRALGIDVYTKNHAVYIGERNLTNES